MADLLHNDGDGDGLPLRALGHVQLLPQQQGLHVIREVLLLQQQ